MNNNMGKLAICLPVLMVSIWFVVAKEEEEISKELEEELKKYKMGIYPVIDASIVPPSQVVIQNLKSYLSALLGLDESEIIDAPDELDWREIGVVGPVKNQAECRSSWAFATTGLLLSQQVIRRLTKKIIPLSEQQLIDCSESNYGCAGGQVHRAIKDIIKMGGIMSERNYPYTGKNSSICKFKKSKSVMTVKGVKLIERNETIIKHVVANYGPIAVSFHVSKDFLNKYHANRINPVFRGVWSEKRCNKKKVNHSVLLVGYGKDEESGKDYWLLQNSWGVEWGDGGYFRMERNAGGMCGIDSRPVVATF